jgi:hypothetical protein
MNNE